MGRIKKPLIMALIVTALVGLSTCNNNLTTALQDKIEKEKSEIPIPGGGGVLTTTVGMENITVSWTKGSDNKTPESDLEYLVCVSDNAADVATVEEAVKYAFGVFEKDITSKEVTGLLDAYSYWVNVVVRDGAGNKAVYTAKSDTTVKHPRIYWVDMNSIRRADMDGTSSSAEEIASGLNNPHSLAVDPDARKVYWTTTSGSPIMIQRTDMDGGGAVENVITSHLAAPYGLAFDSEHQALYWTDYSNNTIYKATLPISSTDAADHVFTTSNVVNPLGIDVDMVNGRVYWIEDRTTKAIRECAITGGTITDREDVSFVAPYDLAVYPEGSEIFIAESDASAMKCKFVFCYYADIYYLIINPCFFYFFYYPSDDDFVCFPQKFL